MCNDGYGLHGRYVNLLIPGEDNVLTVCEVVVFGRRVRQVCWLFLSMFVWYAN